MTGAPRGRPQGRHRHDGQVHDRSLGDITFNADGDTSQKIVSIYSVDPAGANGKGDWKFETQVDYASSSQPDVADEAGDRAIPGLASLEPPRPADAHARDRLA